MLHGTLWRKPFLAWHRQTLHIGTFIIGDFNPTLSSTKPTSISSSASYQLSRNTWPSSAKQMHLTYSKPRLMASSDSPTNPSNSYSSIIDRMAVSRTDTISGSIVVLTDFIPFIDHQPIGTQPSRRMLGFPKPKIIGRKLALRRCLAKMLKLTVRNSSVRLYWMVHICRRSTLMTMVRYLFISTLTDSEFGCWWQEILLQSSDLYPMDIYIYIPWENYNRSGGRICLFTRALSAVTLFR